MIQPSATSQSLPRRHGTLRQVNVMTAPQLLAPAIPCPIFLRYRNRLFSHNEVQGAIRKEEYLHWVSTLLAPCCARHCSCMQQLHGPQILSSSANTEPDNNFNRTALHPNGVNKWPAGKSPRMASLPLWPLQHENFSGISEALAHGLFAARQTGIVHSPYLNAPHRTTEIEYKGGESLMIWLKATDMEIHESIDLVLYSHISP